MSGHGFRRVGAGWPVWLLLFSLWGSLAARADCAAPAPQVFWTYPADGDVDVPTDSLIWIRRAGIRSQSEMVLLNDEPLSRVGLAYDAVLEPNTVYTASFSGESVRGAPFQTEFTFTTGSRLTPAPERPRVVGHHVTLGVDAVVDACLSEMLSVGCYDTGEDTLVSFDVEPSGFLWALRVGDEPAEHLTNATRCGGRALTYTYAHDVWFQQDCVTVTALSPSGSEVTSEPYCALQQPVRDLDTMRTPADAAVPDESGLPFGCVCVTAARPVPVGVFLGLTVALLVGGRRRSSRRGGRFL